jgi:hypothetical protein
MGKVIEVFDLHGNKSPMTSAFRFSAGVFGGLTMVFPFLPIQSRITVVERDGVPVQPNNPFGLYPHEHHLTIGKIPSISHAISFSLPLPPFFVVSFSCYLASY